MPITLFQRVQTAPPPAGLLQLYANLIKDFPLEEVPPEPERRDDRAGAPPVGVVGRDHPRGTTPLALAMFKLGPALAAGCTVVLKPSPETALDSYVLGDAAAEAGLPPGVLNIVLAGREAGASLVTHPPRRQDRVHRVDGGRPDHRRRVRPADPPLHPGAGRQVGGDLPRRRGHRHLQGRPGHRVVHEQQPDVHHPVADPGAPLPVRRGGRGGGQLRPRADRGQTRWTRRRTCGPMASETHLNRVLGYIEVGKNSDARLDHGRRPPGRPGPGLVRRADRVRRRAQHRPAGPRRGVRPGHRRDPVRDRRRGGGHRQRQQLRPRPASVWTADEDRGVDVAPPGAYRQPSASTTTTWTWARRSAG